MRYLLLFFPLLLAACGSVPFQKGWERRMLEFQAEAKTMPKGGKLLIGDSITHGWPRPLFPAGWSNRGIGGDTTRGVLSRLRFHLSEEQPSRVALFIGINDLVRGEEEGLVRRYEAILSRILEALPPEKITVISLLPTVSGTWDVAVANAAIAALCSRLGITYLDAFRFFLLPNGSTNESLYWDDLHPNSAGYLVLLDAVRDGLK